MNLSRKVALGLVAASSLLLTACGSTETQQSPATSQPASQASTTTSAAAPDRVEKATMALPEDEQVADYFSAVLATPEVTKAFGDVRTEIWQDRHAAEKLLLDDRPELAVVPVQLAARAFNEGAPIKLTAATFWHPLALFGQATPPEDPKDVAQWADPLRDKTIVTALPEASVPILALEHILSRNEVSAKISYVDSPEAAHRAVAAGDAAAALDFADVETELLPQFNLQDEWARTTGSLPRLFWMGLVADEELIADHRDAVRTLTRSTIDQAGENANPILPARDVSSELARFYENIGQNAEDVLGGRAIDADFFVQRRA
ncbi:hypothetical protein CATYP_04130 [Corynebacterium atypicum]|uniref:SsuA/THI5-like domain-containing protein n=1 Tax=Corynebacterium atypicum TaxID=191610 RepID=A0ABM5QMF4_9CORY|nr:hypothetical protein [Corynebacterium atypicum]AIG63975.1 hypothetical protein CATYP_04130 [Corynebacterium atypicum]